MILRRQAGDIIDKINTKRGDQSSTTRNWQRVAKSEEAKRKLFIDFTTNKRKNFYGREKRETRKQKFLSKRKSFAMKFYFFPFLNENSILWFAAQRPEIRWKFTWRQACFHPRNHPFFTHTCSNLVRVVPKPPPSCTHMCGLERVEAQWHLV